MAVSETAAEEMQTLLAGITEPGLKKAMQSQVLTFRANAARMDDDPVARDGRQQLGEQAREAELVRDRMARRHHRFELSKGAFQIGIVLASATVITGIGALMWAAGGLGALGLALLVGGVAG